MDMRGSSIKIIASDVTPMWKVRSQMVKSLILRIDAERFSEDKLDEQAFDSFILKMNFDQEE